MIINMANKAGKGYFEPKNEVRNAHPCEVPILYKKATFNALHFSPPQGHEVSIEVSILYMNLQSLVTSSHFELNLKILHLYCKAGDEIMGGHTNDPNTLSHRGIQ